ncbi:kinase-like protein [Hysterangium stoloniferum]|nr:kinase-like protein [Hysterangium stoloniferum]
MYSGVDPPLTPAITVNGFDVPKVDGDAGSFVEQELPLVLQPLEQYIHLGYDPLDMFTDLLEVAQGQYGSVYEAHVISVDGGRSDAVVAVKKVPIPVNGCPKIGQLNRELSLMFKIRHKHVLASDGLFYDFAESMLWIRMELMTRSLADVLVLAEEGLELDESIIARFASDALLALSYLCDNGIAHRDVRSDNLLINSDGVLKLADFSNAVRASKQDPLRHDIVGVHHWQAPEVRTGCYDASKVDVWSLGATVWECAEYVPPFADIEDMSALTNRWPPLSRAEEYSDDLHEFLRLCSESAPERPSANQLLHNPFIDKSCPRSHIVEVLNFCRTLEEGMQEP